MYKHMLSADMQRPISHISYLFGFAWFSVTTGDTHVTASFSTPDQSLDVFRRK
jgi:hypothetical protein